jgi:hypothetical protein
LRKKRNIEKALTPGKLPYFLDRLEMFTQGTQQILSGIVQQKVIYFRVFRGLHDL